jgi:hypothetical protein
VRRRAGVRHAPTGPRRARRRRRVRRAGGWQDDLQPYSTLHPVIQLMIDYRKMQADNPPFAPAEQIPVIDEKLKQSPLKNVVFTLQRNNIN